jgi:hypothetical protein
MRHSTTAGGSTTAQITAWAAPDGISETDVWIAVCSQVHAVRLVAAKGPQCCALQGAPIGARAAAK